MDAGVGVVGLGPMGQALAGALIAAGHEVTVWDRDTGKVATTAMIGATTAVSAHQVAQESDVVFTALPDPATVVDIALKPDDGILSGLPEGGLLVDMSTGEPEVAVRLDKEFTGVGRRFVDAPVSGKAPTMAILAGAREEELGADVVELFHDIASNVVYCGARGTGYAAKLVNQHIKYAWYLATAEALLVAERTGLDPEAAIRAVEVSSGSKRGFEDAAAYFRGDNTAVRTHGPVRTIAKDMRLASAMAEAAGVATPILQVVADFFATADDSEFREMPFPASIALLENLRLTAPIAAERRAGS